MTFGSPEWFLLLPACLFIGWFWKSLRLWSPLRLLLVLLCTFALADPKMNVQEDALELDRGPRRQGPARVAAAAR
jgi:hypothetical protein